MNRTLLLLLASFLAVAGFVVAGPDGGDAARGKKIYFDHGDYEYPSCAHCHATVSVKDELKQTGTRHIAFPVFNSANRGAWKNKKAGELASAGDAGNICVKAFQKREKLPAKDIADLNAFLATVAPDKDVKPRKIKYKPAVLTSFDGGDAAKGKKHVEVVCGTCHGDSDKHLAFSLRAGRVKKDKLAQKVRGWVKDRKTGKLKFSPSAGMMSFFATNRLSDAELLDIIAYLGK